MKNKRKIMVFFVLIFAVAFLFAGCDLFGKKETLTLSTYFKTAYLVGEELDITGGVLTYTDANGKEFNVAVNESMISGFNTQTKTTTPRTMIISYKNLTFTVNYTVSENSSDEIDIVAGDVYYAENANRQGYYWYVVYEGNNELFIALLDLAPQDFILSENITDNGEYLEVDVERSIVNNKVKYSGSVVDPGQSTHEVSLTVTNSAQIHVDYSGMGRQINIDLNKFTGQTTSAIALSVGDVYKSNSSDDLYVSLTNNNTIKIYSGSSITKAEFLQLNEEDADLVFRPFTSTVTKHKYSYHISVDGFGDNTYLIIDISFSGNDNNAIIMEYYVHNSQTNLNSNYNSFSLTKI